MKASPEGPADTVRRRQRRAIVWRAQRMMFWLVYDHLGQLVALNVASLVLLLVPLWATARLIAPHPAAVAGVVGVYTCLLAAGYGHLVNTLLAGEAFAYRHVAVGIRRFGVPALFLGFLFAAGTFGSGLGIWFYGSVVAARHPLAGPLLAQVCACSGAVVSMAAFYALPALLAQRGSPVRALRVSLFLVARHPLASAGFLLSAGIYGVIMATPPGLVLLSVVPLVTLACCAYELLARYHDPEDGAGDEEDDCLNRGIRDFLFPWKE